MIRPLLWPLTPLYATAAAAKNAAYDCGWVKARRLQAPVVSVGNISAGGAGKTPLVIALAALLAKHGVRVDVLSRGYGRDSDAVERVDPDGSAERFGDEPLLIARATGEPVYVGASRYEAGLLAERSERRVHLLDDGFQHRKLARDVDIVLVRARDLADGLLPSGNLREPVRALKRATVIVVRRDEVSVVEELKRRGFTQPVWLIDRKATLPENVRRAIAFCGIAHSQEFFRSLRAAGVEVIGKQGFRDHHRYSGVDIQQLIKAARVASADSFLTTEKDFVRFSDEQKKSFEAVARLEAVNLTVTFCDEAAVLEQLRSIF